ncbi:homoserine O-acetyltransferase MetA [Curtanaerobium respiraculi]|uniref:homoserine O-acetyltransferase MetA n=1 Tax=Curtanaerobium respiraculi TaxID=2949669 RepID=UPI0024B38B0C|nr:homoserine O-succinyltransferase [Curtanaerobium respiraculi]
MPIRIPDSLPATSTLEGENIFVMTEYRAMHQDIRPLRVLLLNLMPTKVATETQILRKLSNTPLQVNVGLLHTATHISKNTSAEHLSSFYVNLDDVRDQRFDGLIITGAPVEHIEFEDLDYWPELVDIMEWSRTHVFSTFYICWGAEAGMYHHYGIPKRPLHQKMSGVFKHRLVKPTSPLVRGFADEFWAPHSHHYMVSRNDVLAQPELEIIAESGEAGLYLVKSTDSRDFFVFGHSEYDTDTLANEYRRDTAKGLDPAVPLHYFPGDDPANEPENTWRAEGQLLYTNWLNYYVYQATPYDIDALDGLAV